MLISRTKTLCGKPCWSSHWDVTWMMDLLEERHDSTWYLLPWVIQGQIKMVTKKFICVDWYFHFCHIFVAFYFLFLLCDLWETILRLMLSIAYLSAYCWGWSWNSLWIEALSMWLFLARYLAYSHFSLCTWSWLWEWMIKSIIFI